MRLFNQIYNQNDQYNDHPKYVLNHIAEYVRGIVVCPYTVMEYPYKRDKVIVAACSRFDLAFDVVSILNPLNCSYLLGGSELVVDSFVRECGQLLGSIEYYEAVSLVTARGCVEVMEYHRNLFSSMDKKLIFGKMIEDLQYWGDKYQFDIDKVHVGGLFKSEKADRVQFLTKRDKR